MIWAFIIFLEFFNSVLFSLIFKIYLKAFILPRVAELFIHKEKQRGCLRILAYANI